MSYKDLRFTVKNGQVYFENDLIGTVEDYDIGEDMEVYCVGGPPLERYTGKKVLSLTMVVDYVPYSDPTGVNPGYRKIDLNE